MNAPLPLTLTSPPHDPDSLLLNGRVGWRASAPAGKLDRIDSDPCDGSLAIARLPGAARKLDEASGSLGGLRPPGNVALGPDGSVYLLDAKALKLERFDPCCCRFDEVPCLGGEGGEPRQLRNPGGIAICGGNLFICDTGIEGSPAVGPCDDAGALQKRLQGENHRVSIFALKGFALRGHLRPPAKKLPWKPAAIAFDSLARAWVADALGRLHRFAPSGAWERDFQGLPGAKHIAIDCRDRISIVAPGGVPAFAAFDRDGSALPLPQKPYDLASAFPGIPFGVDAAGNLDLRACCEPPTACVTSKNCASRPKAPSGIFDPSGAPLDKLPAAPTKIFEASGLYRAGPLDSKTAQCQWHRVVLHADIPAGTSIAVRSFCADELYRPEELDTLAQWQTNAVAQDTERGLWDCLVRSAPGRYLWLELEFKSGGAATPHLCAMEIEFPRVSLRRFLPAVFGEEAASADFTDRFLALFDTPLRSIERQVDGEARLFDPASAPARTDPKTGADFPSWLASWIGVGFDRQWDESTRRRFLKSAGSLFDRRGTFSGLREQLLILLGFDKLAPCRPDVHGPAKCVPEPLNCAPEPQAKAWCAPPLILEHFRLRRWLWLGAARLGEQAMLWGKRIVNRSQLDANAQVAITKLIMTPDPERDPFLVFANQFSVFVPARCRTSDKARKALDALLKAEAPAHARCTVHYVESRFRIGVQSMLGFDAVVAALPQGIALGATPLGPASVLTAPPHLTGGPSIAVGKEGRVGTTTLLS
jgi:phage tail-like protein